MSSLVSETHDSSSDQVRRARPLRWKVDDDVKTALLSIYQQTQYPSADMRREISAKFGVTEKQVQVWFRNQRQREKYTISVPVQGGALLAPFNLASSHSGGRPHALGRSTHALDSNPCNVQAKQQVFLDPRLCKLPVQPSIGRPSSAQQCGGGNQSMQPDMLRNVCASLTPPSWPPSTLPQPPPPLLTPMQQPSYPAAQMAEHDAQLFGQTDARPQDPWPGLDRCNYLVNLQGQMPQATLNSMLASPTPWQWSAIPHSMQMQQQ
eukprot:6209510-Pleurochrysis_carterae.AAC.1